MNAERWELVRVDKALVEQLLGEEPRRVMLLGLERFEDGTLELVFRTPDDHHGGAVEACSKVYSALTREDDLGPDTSTQAVEAARRHLAEFIVAAGRQKP